MRSALGLGAGLPFGGGLIGSGLSSGTAAQSIIAALTAAGRKGFFPSTNPATGWYQDSAGTIPAAYEQPVGRILDLSGSAYHATQATSANRPTYTLRVNMLQRTDNLTAGWTVIGTPSATATTLTDDDGASNEGVYQNAATCVASAQYAFTFVVAKTSGAASFPGFGVSTTGGTVKTAQIAINTDTGAYTGRSSYSDYDSVAIVTYPNDALYWHVTVMFTTGAGNTVLTVGAYPAVNTNAGAIWAATTQGSVTTSRFDLRLAAFAGMNLPAYQRVGDGTAGVADYDTAGFRDMLWWNGTTHAMATPAIDLTGSNQIEALLNVVKVSDASTYLAYETSVSANSNSGSMYIAAPGTIGSNYSCRSHGTVVQTASYTDASVAAPNLACLRHVSSIPGKSLTLYRNGVSIVTNTGDQGAGKYGNHPLYIGARAGTSLYFNGYMLPGPLFDSTGISSTLLDQVAREQAALWGVTI